MPPLLLIRHARTVLTLLLARANRLDPFTLWRSLRMPEAFVVGSADFGIRDRLAP